MYLFFTFLIPNVVKWHWACPRNVSRASPSGNLSGLRKSLGRRGWISQYLPRFGGVRTFSHHQSFYREWVRKSFRADDERMMITGVWFGLYLVRGTLFEACCDGPLGGRKKLLNPALGSWWRLNLVGALTHCSSNQQHCSHNWPHLGLWLPLFPKYWYIKISHTNS